MADTMTSQNTDLSSWDTLYIGQLGSRGNASDLYLGDVCLNLAQDWGFHGFLQSFQANVGSASLRTLSNSLITNIQTFRARESKFNKYTDT
jgi:hypothetical protein